jgi:CTP:molybdopterin cytidylyltransferase MocA
MTTAGLILAAGAGTRYGQPKAPVVVDGERLIDRAIRIMTEAGCDPILVVLGAWTGHVEGADIVVNDNWPEGMGSSLRAGLTELRDTTDATCAVITLVDLPGLTAEAIRRVIQSAPDAAIGQATYSGRRGHPVRIARELWGDAIDVARGDEGARQLIQGRDDVALIEVGDVADGADLDVP